MNNVLYFDKINDIGGVETTFYEIAKKYNDWDIVILYKEADNKQLERLNKYVKTIKYIGQKIKCIKLFLNYDISIIGEIEFEESFEIIHTMYSKTKKKPHIDSRINRYLGVSQAVCDDFKELTGINCELCYNPLTIEEVKPAFILVSATRLTSEKGLSNIYQLTNQLDKHNVKYIFLIFSNTKEKVNNPNLFFVEPKIDIKPYIKMADFVVQLSDENRERIFIYN